MNKNIKLKLPIEVIYILSALTKAGYEAYIVGGAVRDILLHKDNNTDYDFTTNATPEQIQTVFPENYYENNFGTVGVAKKHLWEQMGLLTVEHEKSNEDQPLSKNKVIDLKKASKIHISLRNNSSKENASIQEKNEKKDIFEITTFRFDGEYTNFRKPEKVTWGETLEDDLSRRDFTINALAISLDKNYLADFNITNSVDTKKDSSITVSSDVYKIHDLFTGIQDLDANLIRTVGDSDKRFKEDALRMLRAIRFSVQLNMQIEEATFESIKQNHELIKYISFERIRDELLKMLKSHYPKEAIELLDETGLLKFIMPELQEGKGVMQAGHHTTDVWTHSLDALDTCPSADPVVRLSTLIHDIAKPRTHKLINGLPTFYNHEIIGARIARDIAKRLRLSKKDIDRVFLLVRHHMFYYQPENTDSSIRRFMRKVGLENINDILDLREGDRLGSGARETSWRLEEMKQRMLEQINQPFSITDMDIDGNDLMTHFGLKPSRKIGEILKALFEKVMENPELNKKELLLKEAEQLL